MLLREVAEAQHTDMFLKHWVVNYQAGDEGGKGTTDVINNIFIIWSGIQYLSSKDYYIMSAARKKGAKSPIVYRSGGQNNQDAGDITTKCSFIASQTQTQCRYL